jgi:hypothetical protein
MRCFERLRPPTMSSCSIAYCPCSRSLAAVFIGFLRLRALALPIALCLAGTAQGATITVHSEDTDGRIFVDIAGEITLADIKNFSDKVEHLPTEKVYVSLSSQGGDAVAAEIGNYIRLSGIKTLVPENKSCVSVCAIIWWCPRSICRSGEYGYRLPWGVQ